MPLTSQLWEYRNECDDEYNTVTEGQKNIVDGVIFLNGVIGTLFLHDCSFDSGLEGHEVF